MLHFPPRRAFLRSAVAGNAIFPALVSELLAEDASRGTDPLAPPTAALRNEGEERHLPVYVWWCFAR